MELLRDRALVRFDEIDGVAAPDTGAMFEEEEDERVKSGRSEDAIRWTRPGPTATSEADVVGYRGGEPGGEDREEEREEDEVEAEAMDEDPVVDLVGGETAVTSRMKIPAT